MKVAWVCETCLHVLHVMRVSVIVTTTTTLLSPSSLSSSSSSSSSSPPWSSRMGPVWPDVPSFCSFQGDYNEPTSDHEATCLESRNDFFVLTESLSPSSRLAAAVRCGLCASLVQDMRRLLERATHASPARRAWAGITLCPRQSRQPRSSARGWSLQSPKAAGALGRSAATRTAAEERALIGPWAHVTRHRSAPPRAVLAWSCLPNGADRGPWR